MVLGVGVHDIRRLVRLRLFGGGTNLEGKGSPAGVEPSGGIHLRLASHDEDRQTVSVPSPTEVSVRSPAEDGERGSSSRLLLHARLGMS